MGGSRLVEMQGVGMHMLSTKEECIHMLARDIYTHFLHFGVYP